jgi:O-acetylserine/cysteine efflux transporter
MQGDVIPFLINSSLIFSLQDVKMLSFSDLLLALLANFAWGFNLIAGKIGAHHFQPLLFTSIRFTMLFILMLPWVKPAPGYMKPLLRVAFLMGVIHFSMIFIGLEAGGNVASVAITTQLYVPFSAILASVFLKEQITFLRILAISIAFLGVMLIGFDPVVLNHIDAILWVTGAAFAMATATILMRRCPNLGVFRLQAWIALVAMPSLLILSLIFEQNQIHLLTHTPIIQFWSPLYSAIGASIVGHGIVYYLVGRYQVSVVTPLMLLAPILASIFGILILGDSLGWKLILGGTLTLVGIALVAILPTQKISS